MPDYSLDNHSRPQSANEQHSYSKSHESAIKSDPDVGAHDDTAHADSQPEHFNPVKVELEHADTHRAPALQQASAAQVKLEPQQDCDDWNEAQMQRLHSTRVLHEGTEALQHQPGQEQLALHQQAQRQQQQEDEKLAAEAESEMDKLKREHMRARFQGALHRRQQVSQVKHLSKASNVHTWLPILCMAALLLKGMLNLLRSVNPQPLT